MSDALIGLEVLMESPERGWSTNIVSGMKGKIVTVKKRVKNLGLAITVEWEEDPRCQCWYTIDNFSFDPGNSNIRVLSSFVGREVTMQHRQTGWTHSPPEGETGKIIGEWWGDNRINLTVRWWMHHEIFYNIDSFGCQEDSHIFLGYSIQIVQEKPSSSAYCVCGGPTRESMMFSGEKFHVCTVCNKEAPFLGFSIK